MPRDDSSDAKEGTPAGTTPIRIALVTTELRPGGAERNLVSLAVGLKDRGFRPHVFSLMPQPPAETGQLVDELRRAGVAASFASVKRSWQFFTAARRLRGMLNEFSPEVVQSFLFHANVVSAAALCGSKVPLVAGLRVAQPQRLRQLVERNLAGRYAAITCVSPGVATAAEQAGLPREKMHVIPNGLNPARFTGVQPADLSKFGLSRNCQAVLFVGRLDLQKGVDHLIDSSAKFLPSATDAELLIVGGGPERRRLMAQANRLKVADRIHFVPWQSDVLPVIASADLIVAASRYEGMSNVLLEAAALGRAIVATDVEGTREILGRAAKEQIVRPENFGAKVAQLLTDAEERRRLGDENRAVLEQFSLAKTLDAYESLYRELSVDFSP